MRGMMQEMAIVFTGERLDRAAERRTDPEWVAAQAASPNARAVLAGDAGIHVTATSRGSRCCRWPRSTPTEPLLLGLDATGPVFAVDANGTRSGCRARRRSPLPTALDRQGAIAAQGEGSPDPATGTRALGLRAAAATLPHADGGLAAYAAAL